MLRELRQEVLKMIGAKLAPLMSQANYLQAVAGNRTLQLLPTTTTTLTTAGTALTTTAALTLRSGTGKVRATLIANVLPGNTLQANILPSISYTANGANTTSSAFAANQSVDLPAVTGSTGTLSVIQQVSNTGWTQGQTVIATVTLTPSVTGASLGTNGMILELEEVF